MPLSYANPPTPTTGRNACSCRTSTACSFSTEAYVSNNSFPKKTIRYLKPNHLRSSRALMNALFSRIHLLFGSANIAGAVALPELARLSRPVPQKFPATATRLIRQLDPENPYSEKNSGPLRQESSSSQRVVPPLWRERPVRQLDLENPYSEKNSGPSTAPAEMRKREIDEVNPYADESRATPPVPTTGSNAGSCRS